MSIDYDTMVSAFECCLQKWGLKNTLKIICIDMNQKLKFKDGYQETIIRKAARIELGTNIENFIYGLQTIKFKADYLIFHPTWNAVENTRQKEDSYYEQDRNADSAGFKKATILFYKDGQLQNEVEIYCSNEINILTHTIKRKMELKPIETERVIRPLPNFIELDKILTELENASKTLTKEDHEKIIPIIRRLRIIIS